MIEISFFPLFILLLTAKDHFADNLSLPTDVELVEPLDKELHREDTSYFRLYNGMQGGMYIMDIRCNPGEPGCIYIKANEITQGTPLSADRMPRERINGSDKADELFDARLEFTVYEGNWKQYYGAHMELWFVPNSGAQERKIHENNYKIDGWNF